MIVSPTAGKKKVWRYCQIVAGTVVAVVPFVIIFRKVNPDDLATAVLQVRWWTVPLLFAMVFAAMVLQGIRWWVLVRAFTDRLSFMQSLGVHFKSLFYSLFLPNSTVQEIVRSVVAIKHVGAVTSWASAWINKITGILVSYAFSMYGLILLSVSSDGLPGGIVIGVLGLFIIMVILVLFSFSKRMTRPFIPVFNMLIPGKVTDFLHRLRDGIYRFRDHRKALVFAGVIAVAVQALMVLGVAFVIKGVTGRMFLGECFAFIPLIEMISLAQPFTPNGVGVRDALVALMFRHLGLTPEQLGTYIIISNLSLLLKLTGVVPVIAGTVTRRGKKAEKRDINASGQ